MSSVIYDSIRLGSPQAKMEPHPPEDFVPQWKIPEAETADDTDAPSDEEARVALKARILAAFGIKTDKP